MKCLICILFLTVNLSYSQSLHIRDPITLKLKDTQFKPGVIFSAGAGTSVHKKSFILSMHLTGDFHTHINVSAGADIYFILGNHQTTKYSLNLIPYYVLNIGDVLFFRAGIGISIWESTLKPIFSTKFDFGIFRNNFLGIEIKSLVPVPPPADDNSFVPPMLLLLINYSMKIQL